MNITDAIVVGEGWISEHYFTTDAKSQSFQAKVIERRKSWDAEAGQGRPTVRSRFTEARQQLEAGLGALSEHTDPIVAREAADDVHQRLVSILGLDAHGLHVGRQGRVLRVSAPGIADGAPLALRPEAVLHRARWARRGIWRIPAVGGPAAAPERHRQPSATASAESATRSRSSAFDSSVSHVSPVPTTRSARARFDSRSAAIRSSIVPAQTSLRTCTS